jgi:hypothetical protein
MPVTFLRGAAKRGVGTYIEKPQEAPRCPEISDRGESVRFGARGLLDMSSGQTDILRILDSYVQQIGVLHLLSSCESKVLREKNKVVSFINNDY